MGLYSKLDAVNYILLSSGEHIINDLSSEEGVDSDIALFVLDTTTKSSISRGLVNNKFVASFTKNAGGLILLPKRTVFAQVAEEYVDPETGIQFETSVKANPDRLWNLTKQTDVFSKDLKISIIVEIPWDDLDTSIQRGIMATAAREYQIFTQADEFVDRYLGQREAYMMARGRAADISKKDRSIWRGGVSDLRNNPFGYNSGRADPRRG